MANIVTDTGSTNGICIPVAAAELERLQDRERRYRLWEVSAVAHPFAAQPASAPTPGASVGFEDRVLTFVGADDFTREPDVAAGVVARSYLDTIRRGVRFWDRRVPGFAARFDRSTEPPPRVRALRRIDHTDS
jgi:hypothetical protein